MNVTDPETNDKTASGTEASHTRTADREKRLLWFFVVALLGANVVALTRGLPVEGFGARQRGPGPSSISDALAKSSYADEEEALLTRVRSLPLTFPGLHAPTVPDDTVQFFLIASVDDCTNSIEDEVMRLNAMTRLDRHVSGVRGFLVDEDQTSRARALITRLSPRPEFPMVVQDVISQVPSATSPLVLVVRPEDGRILDAHKPIPEDFTKRDAFYERWLALFGTSLGQEPTR